MNQDASHPPAKPPPAGEISPRRLRRAIGPGELQALTQACLRDDLHGARAVCTGLRGRGASVRELLSDLVTPVARHLGELWDADDCDFVHVAISISLLRRLVLEIAPDPSPDVPADADALRIMLVPVPGSQHTLGLLVLSRYFQLAGWAVWCSPTITLSELREQAAGTWFDVVGLSIGSSRHAPMLAEAVAAVRAHSVNPEVRVIAGGPALLDDDMLGTAAGADGAALDAEGAVRLAKALAERVRGAGVMT
jgi:methylmalonyl-CoA mutase cobalamin-binding subunit